MLQLLHPLLEQIAGTGFLEFVGDGLVVTGLSGGADSVALVLALKKLGCRMLAAHCNFGLRGEESERDEAFVRQFCAQHVIHLETVRFDTQGEAKKHGWSIEMAARELRYKWFEELRRQHNAVCIAVAHHRDDSNETLLLNLLRGTGLRGLCGMPFQNNRHVVRPLIQCSRADILDFLKACGAKYVEDSSNDDVQFKRNKIRHEVLPLLRSINPSVDETLQQTAKHLREYFQCAEDHLHQLIAMHETMQNDIHRLPLNWLKDNPQRHLIVRHWLEGKFPSATIDEISELEGRVGALYKSRKYVCTYSASYLEYCEIFSPLEQTLLPTNGSVDLLDMGTIVVEATNDCSIDKTTSCRAKLDKRAIVGRLWVRNAMPGDRFQPYGMNGSKLLSDYLTEKKLSRLEKMKTLVVGDERGILWVVGHRIDQRGAILPDALEVVSLEMRFN